MKLSMTFFNDETSVKFIAENESEKNILRIVSDYAFLRVDSEGQDGEFLHCTLQPSLAERLS